MSNNNVVSGDISQESAALSTSLEERTWMMTVSMRMI